MSEFRTSREHEFAGLRLRRARWVAIALGCYALVGGLASFAGWMFDVPRLTDWDADGIAIQPNAALAATCTGAAIVLIALGRRRWAVAFSALVALIGAATLFEYLTGLSLGIDALLLFDRPWGRVGVVVPGRMGPPGTIAWTLIGSALLLAAGRQRPPKLVPMLGLVVVAIAGISITGYLYGASSLYVLPRLTVIALQTSTFVLAAGIGLVAIAPEHEPMRTILGPSAAGLFLRRVMVFVLILPILLGFLRIEGERRGLYETSMGVALLVVTLTAMLCAAVWWGVRSVAEREQSIENVRQRMAADLSGLMRLHEVARLCSSPNVEAQRRYDAIVEAAIAITAADKGNLQLIHEESNTLRIVAYRGFSRKFLDFFAEVQIQDPSACGTSLSTGERTIVAEITQSKIFANRPSLPILLGEGIQAVQSTPLIGSTGRVLGMLSTHFGRPHVPEPPQQRLLDLLARQAADYVQRSQAEDLLKEADRRKDEFLAVLAHELRNPLAPVRNAANYLKLRDLSDTEMRRSVEMIERQSAHMARLLDDLMDVSRITRGILELRRERVDFAKIAEAAIEICRSEIEARGHLLRLDLPSEPIWLDGDRHRLIQVFSNLLSNAGKFSPPGSRIGFSALVANGVLHATVSDTGIGIDKHKLAEIFELFVQVDQSLDRQSGLGIGLTLVRTLIQLHGGTVRAESDGENRGSRFIVGIPVARTEDEYAEPETREAATVSSKCRILVADDNEDVAESFRMLLALDGHDVRVALDGEAALQTAAQFRPDVAFLDLGMPLMDGYEVARRIRCEPWGKATRLIAVTGWGQSAERDRTRGAGFDDHLTKPVDPDRILKALGKGVSGTPAAS